MPANRAVSRRDFLATVAATAGVATVSPWATALGKPVVTSCPDTAALRTDIVRAPVRVALHRANTFTKVYKETEGQPWIVRKALGLREYFETVPLYVRDHDRIAGSISELPGAMPLMVELGIGQNGIYTGEVPKADGYLKGQVPDELREYWKNRNLWGHYRIDILGQEPVKSADDLPWTTQYKFISNQGHLSPSYEELLRIGLGGLLAKVKRRQQGETDPEKIAFLTAAEHTLTGLSTWAKRYGKFLANEAKICRDAGRAEELKEMATICKNVATKRPQTFREAMQLIWFAHQSIHIEGHGYSCTPDHIDQLLYPYFTADEQAGRLDNAEVIRLVENFVLKMYDNTFWGPQHHLTQGLCLGGSTPDGTDLTNRLTWLFVEGATNLSLPEPLVWIRWNENIDQEFFDFCLSRLAKSTCFPMMWNDNSVPKALMELGISEEDAYNFIAVGCNELGIPGQMYFNPGAGVSYLNAIQAVMTDGKGLKGQWKWTDVTPSPSELTTFDDFADAVGVYIRDGIESSYAAGMKNLEAQMRWGQTPLTSCFFHGCVEEAHDMTAGTKYNILSCSGTAFANAIDCVAAIRDVVYEKKEATLDEVAEACRANFEGHEILRAQLLAAPKHGNDDPAVDEVITLVERLRDVPMKEICRDPRDGSEFGNCHVVRSSSVRQGLATPATPDGRLAGQPLATSVASSLGCEKSGPTAVLNSVNKLNHTGSWQSGYQVNIRFHAGMIAGRQQRDKLRAMLNVYFQGGGQELQINVIDTKILKAAQKDPEAYRDVVVRVAGFSEFFVNLTPEMQEEIIGRTEHM